MPRECGLGKSVRTRNITNVKSIYHRVCYCGFGLEIQRCFFRIKALAKLDGQGQRPVWPEAKNSKFSLGNTVWENAPWLLRVCARSHLFWSTFWNFLKQTIKQNKTMPPFQKQARAVTVNLSLPHSFLPFSFLFLPHHCHCSLMLSVNQSARSHWQSLASPSGGSEGNLSPCFYQSLVSSVYSQNGKWNVNFPSI